MRDSCEVVWSQTSSASLADIIVKPVQACDFSHLISSDARTKAFVVVEHRVKTDLTLSVFRKYGIEDDVLESCKDPTNLFKQVADFITNKLVLAVSSSHYPFQLPRKVRRKQIVFGVSSATSVLAGYFEGKHGTRINTKKVCSWQICTNSSITVWPLLRNVLQRGCRAKQVKTGIFCYIRRSLCMWSAHPIRKTSYARNEAARLQCHAIRVRYKK